MWAWTCYFNILLGLDFSGQLPTFGGNKYNGYEVSRYILKFTCTPAARNFKDRPTAKSQEQEQFTISAKINTRYLAQDFLCDTDLVALLQFV